MIIQGITLTINITFSEEMARALQDIATRNGTTFHQEVNASIQNAPEFMPNIESMLYQAVANRVFMSDQGMSLN